MGYETQLIIGEDTGQSYSDDGIFFMVHATVDMCKMGDSALFNLPWVNKTPEKEKWYWYSPTGDGDTSYSEDRYGDIPRPVPLADVVNALREDVEKSDYRRFKWALALCESMMKEPGGERFSVLMWGY